MDLKLNQINNLYISWIRQYRDRNSIILYDNDNILFIDNDNIHEFPIFDKKYNNNFICYGTDLIKQNFSFITIKNNFVTNIEEKIKISDNYCCGLYGFTNKTTFLDLAKEIINSNFKTKKCIF